MNSAALRSLNYIPDKDSGVRSISSNNYSPTQNILLSGVPSTRPMDTGRKGLRVSFDFLSKKLRTRRTSD